MRKSTVLLAVAVLVVAAYAAPARLVAQGDPWPRKVVLTNDDGIDAPGLIALARAFAPVTETYVVAPLDNRSASTNYVSAIADGGIDVESRDLGLSVIAFGVDGYPADAVVFALRGLLADDPPDLVISGVNTGPNLSDDWNLSGTVGAAQMAAFLGAPAIAVSGFREDDPETLELIARWVVDLASGEAIRTMEPGTYVTVSVPRRTASEIGGVEVVRRGPRPYRIDLRPVSGTADSPRRRWSLAFTGEEVSAGPGTDLHAYSRGRIAIVPMRVDEHDYALLERWLAVPPTLPPWPASRRDDSAPRPEAASTRSARCEGPGVDPWVTDLRDSVMRYSEFAHFAVRRYGAPTACDGKVTTEFDGARFGRVILTFIEGVTLTVETMPPETSISTFRASGGFGDGAEVRALLREYASGLGLSIDWTAPEIRTEGGEVVHQFWDPEPGLNGSASFIFLDGTLVGVRVSMAL